MPKHLLIDGRNAIYRAVYAGLEDKKFQESKQDYFAIFLRFLNKYINTFKPSNVHIFWDDKRENLWRRKIYPEYKANRPPNEQVDPIIQRQVKVAISICRFIGFRQYYRETQEADDLIYAFCRSIVEDSVIVSSDSDMKQIPFYIKNTSVYNPLAKNAQDILNHNTPEINPIIMKSLVGDKSDNIEGYAGIGPTRGKMLVTEMAARKEFIEKSSNDKYKLNRLLVDLGLNPSLLDNMMYVERVMGTAPRFDFKQVVSLFREMNVTGMTQEVYHFIMPYAKLVNQN